MKLNHLTDSELKEYHRLFKKGISKTQRFESQKIHKTDVKFLYHVVRLLSECEMILTEGDIDLRRNKEHLKAIRRGDVSEEDIKKWFSDKEKQLETIYAESKLPWGPDEAKIKKLLLECLEHHYGNLANCIVLPEAAKLALAEIRDVLDRYEKINSASQ